ncbi:TPA: serine protein kinase RIO [Candidatus Bathyarchaeota archaeon]|nr:serine protein kinase RIO [Candidatus Bathyarchaeota archaeon]
MPVDIYKKVEKKLERKEKRYEVQQLMKEKHGDDYEVLEEVFDRSTLMTIYDFMNRGIIAEIYGTVKAGKEARIYWGVSPEGEDLAIKIYLTVSAEFRRGMLPYIMGDPRFQNIKRGGRGLIYAWARKEFKNLILASEAGVRVPKPIAVSNNVLIMEFIGEKGVGAPTLREIELRRPSSIYRILVSYVDKLYNRAKLVHGDLSEYNIMIWKGKPVIFDVSQAVPLEHPNAVQYLIRDLQNLNRYFDRLGVEVTPVNDLLRRIVGEHV